jgi:hypothetical protein
MSRSYHLSVCGATNADPLPGYQIGVPYSITLMGITSAGCGAAPISFQLPAGGLPPGLFLNEETGEISGTPTSVASGDYEFEVRIQTEST